MNKTIYQYVKKNYIIVIEGNICAGKFIVDLI